MSHSAGPDAPNRGGFSYQPALDGLRAFAVLAVMLYHGELSALSGGYLGVDAFFVLSGFLITSLMLVEVRSTGRLDLVAFWIRRARRLLPALFLILLAVAAFAAFAASTAQVRDLRGDGFATLFYVANWRQVLADRSYFTLFETPSMLQHTWSLAIEEQWYLLWPIVLPFLVRRTGARPGRLLAVIGGLAAVSGALMVLLYEPGRDPSRVYYGTDTRAQSLLIGAGLGVLMLWRRGPRSAGGQRALQLAGIAAAALVGTMWVAVDDGTQLLYQGGFTVEALAVAVVIAAAVQPTRGPLRSLLSWGPLRWIGWISYGLYLWHWPVYVFFTGDRTGLDGTGLLLTRLAITFAIATASYYLVEMPIRRGVLRRRRPLARVVLPVAIAVVAAALVVSTSSIAGIGERREAAARSNDIVDVSKEARAQHRAEQQALATQSRAVSALFFGDSVSESLALGYGGKAAIPELTVQNVAIPGCGVARGKVITDGSTDFGQQDCEFWPDRWREGIATIRPDVSVILSGTWEVFDRHVDGRDLYFGTPEYAAYLRSELERALELLTEDGAPVVMLSATCPDEARLKALFAWSEVIPQVNEIEKEFADAHPDRVAWIDLHDFVCPLSKWDEELDGAPFLPDGIHFSPRSSEIIWDWLAPRILRATDRFRTQKFLGLDRVALWG